MKTITAAVCTLDREDLLRRCLDALLSQEQLEAEDYTVLVVDNSAEHDARPMLEAIAAREPRLHFRHEPRKGVYTARNSALEFAQERDADVLLFTDDDCVAPPNWVRAGVDEPERLEAVFVSGIARSTETLPEVLTPVEIADHKPAAMGATGCIALDARIATEFRFDDRYNRSGGGDKQFTLRLTAAGHQGYTLKDWYVLHLDERSDFRTRVRKFQPGPAARFGYFIELGFPGRAIGYLIGAVRWPFLALGFGFLALLPAGKTFRSKALLKTSKYLGKTIGLWRLVRGQKTDYF